MGLGKGLQCWVGMPLVGFGWLFTGHLVVGLWLDVTGHCRVGM